MVGLNSINGRKNDESDKFIRFEVIFNHSVHDEKKLATLSTFETVSMANSIDFYVKNY
jgi:hypothetical protein